MDGGREISSSGQIYPAGIGHVPVTPAKQGQSASNLIQKDWLKSKFDDNVIQETSAKSLGFREGNLGSTSLMYDFNGGMYNRFSMDDVETWPRISCRELLALADPTAIKGSDDGGAGDSRSGGAAVDISLQLRSNYHGASNAVDTRSQQCGWLNFGNCVSDLNLPPQMETEMHWSTGPSSQFTPVTPDQAWREQRQMVSDIVFPNEDGRTNVAADNKERPDIGEQQQLIIEKPQTDVFTFGEANQYVEKGLTEQTNLNETPQPKQRRRKHRPKVVTEGQPKRGKRSATPKVDGSGSSTGKRKYVRRKGIEKPTETPAGEEASGTIELSTGRQTKKSCKRKITFDEVEQVAEVVVEKAQVEHTVDKTSLTSQAVKICQTVLERQSASPATPSKTEPPQGRSIKDAEHTYRKARCKINFLQETHDKGPSSVSSPNESNCSTSACFNKGEEARGSKQGLSTKIDGMELWEEETYLSMYTDYNSGNKQGMDIPAIYKKDCIGKYQSSITSATISSVSSAQDSDCNFSATQNANKAPEKPIGKDIKDDQQSITYMQASSHTQNSNKGTKAVTIIHDWIPFAGMDGRHHQTFKGASGYKGANKQRTFMEAQAKNFQVSIGTKKRTKKSSMVSSLYNNHQCSTNHIVNAGCHTKLKSKSINEIDALIDQFERLNINTRMAEEDRNTLIPYSSRHHENNALVLYRGDGSIVPYEGLFNPIKKKKPRPKVDLDDETNRVWRLLLEDINSEGIDGTDEAKEKWWEEERRVFHGRADSFIARMHLVQGDRRFSQWKGSVLDSVIGVFLTQNVSDHLSSSAFMSLASRYPLKSNSRSEPLQEEEPILSVEEPCQLDQNETIGWHEESNQPSGDHDPMMLQDADSFEEKEVVNSDEFSKFSVKLNDNLDGMRSQTSHQETIGWHEKSNQPSGDHDPMMLQDADSFEEKEVVNSDEFSKFSVDLNDNLECEVTEAPEKDLAMYKESVVDQIEGDDIVSSQNSSDTSPSSVQSSIVYTAERLRSCSMHPSEEQKDKSRATILSGYPSFVELLHLQGSTTMNETYSQRQPDESSNKKIGMNGLDSMAYSEEHNDSISPGSNSSAQPPSTKEHELQNAGSSGALDVDFEPREERNSIQKKRKECSSEESGLSAESASQATAKMVNTTSAQEAEKPCNTFHAGLQEVCHCEMIAENPKINTEQHIDNNCEVAKVSAETTNATKSNNIMEASGETVHKVVEFNSNDNGGHQIVNGMEVGSSEVKKEKTGKKHIKVDWDSLRLQAEGKQKRERTPYTMDSLDYEALRNADVSEVADTIKERGMNNVLAGRIKALLDRLVRDHGNTDLEWLRDVPPDKAKEYLLSFRGLGLKSVECVRLLTLHHLAFPVDTNVGRIAVRLGWVPLQPLPESLQLHLLELYPIMESIQKYLWPRLCKLDQRTLYELHYQMITFGKVFCTKSKPNCNACPMRGECRHFASAFASARLGLPAPDERTTVGLIENRTAQSPIKLIDQRQPTLPPASGQRQDLAEVQNCNPVIEDPATPMPIVEVSATPGPIVELPATPGPIVEIPATPWPIVEVPATPEPIVEVPATPEPEQIQQEFDIEDFCEDTEEIPVIRLDIEEFTQNLQTYMEKHMELGECDMSKALVALTTEAAAIPTPKLKNVSQLRTEHQVYELPDSHPLLHGLDPREPDDPCSYLLAIWTPGETASSVQPPGGQCCSQEAGGTLCNEETCFFCNSTREANSQTVRGTLLIPCRTATRGSFPLNGTYFQVNEVFADHESSLNPIDVPRSWLWNLPRRTVYFGTSIPTIFKGLTTEDIQYCFWRGFVCVRGFDQKTRAPRPLMARLHFPASKIKRSRTKTDEN